MTNAEERASITERQRDILEMLDRRVPIKVIASELSISETRVNQHIRTLKQSFGARDLSQLIAYYREGSLAPSTSPYRDSAYRKNHLPVRDLPGNTSSRVADGELVLADAQTLPLDAPWSRAGEPRVVPGVLDGKHAVVRRLALMLAIACGMVATLVLVILGAVTIGDVLDGVMEVPANGTDAAG